MRVRYFLLLLAVCLIWAFNNVLSKIIVTDWAIPPLFYASLRFAVVALVMLPWLFPMPRPAWRIVAIGICLGGGSFRSEEHTSELKSLMRISYAVFCLKNQNIEES